MNKKCSNCNSTAGMASYTLLDYDKKWQTASLPDVLHFCPECSIVYTAEEYNELEDADET